MFSTFLCHWENRFWKCFWISKWDFLINHKGIPLLLTLSHKGISLWFIRKSHVEIQKYFQNRISQSQNKSWYFVGHLYLGRSACSFDLWCFQNVLSTPSMTNSMIFDFALFFYGFEIWGSPPGDMLWYTAPGNPRQPFVNFEYFQWINNRFQLASK